MERICLIVDDEPQIRAYLKAILRKERYQAIEAGNAVQAFKTVQMLDGDLDLLVTGITMPGDMDGLDLARAVRLIFPKIPVLLVSGYADTISTREPLREFSFVRKPFTPVAILEAARRAASGSSCDSREASAA
jgi:DNA-binding NtrC family response regulator